MAAKTLFATHYHELTDLALTRERVKNYNIAVKEWNDQIIFLRKIVKGGASHSYGIQVARLAGLPGGGDRAGPGGSSQSGVGRIRKGGRTAAGPQPHGAASAGAPALPVCGRSDELREHLRKIDINRS